MTSMHKLPTKNFQLYEHDRLIMQLGIGMTLFFPRPFSRVRENILIFWQRFLDLVGKDTFTWARLGGGNKSREVRESTLKTVEAWLKGKKPYGDTCWISVHDGVMDELGRYSFMLTGYEEADDPEFDTEAGFVEIALPVDLLESKGTAFIADQLIRMADPVPYSCGVVGYVFHRSPYEYGATIGKMWALSQRFEGVEVSANKRLCFLASKGITTVNWITFVGNALVDQLGGMAALASRLPAEAEVIQQSHGVAIRTGSHPLLGDRNTGKDELVHLRKVYQALKPVQFVDADYDFDPFEFDGDRTVEWLERLGRQWK